MDVPPRTAFIYLVALCLSPKHTLAFRSLEIGLVEQSSKLKTKTNNKKNVFLRIWTLKRMFSSKHHIRTWDRYVFPCHWGRLRTERGLRDLKWPHSWDVKDRESQVQTADQWPPARTVSVSTVASGMDADGQRAEKTSWSCSVRMSRWRLRVTVSPCPDDPELTSAHFLLHLPNHMLPRK